MVNQVLNLFKFSSKPEKPGLSSSIHLEVLQILQIRCIFFVKVVYNNFAIEQSQADASVSLVAL